MGMRSAERVELGSGRVGVASGGGCEPRGPPREEPAQGPEWVVHRQVAGLGVRRERSQSKPTLLKQVAQHLPQA